MQIASLRRVFVLFMTASMSLPVWGEVVLGPRPPEVAGVTNAPPPIPGEDAPTPWLLYQQPRRARRVEVSGAWDRWSKRYPMTLEDSVWRLDMRTLEAPFGKFNYKFIVDGKWEDGANRVLYLNTDSELEVPSPLIVRSLVQGPREIEVFLRNPVEESIPLKVYVSPEMAVERWKVASAAELGYPEGYVIRENMITFYLDQRTYGLDLAPTSQVTIAGNFNGWNSNPGPRWTLRDAERNGLWELAMPLQAMRVPKGETNLIFKFVINGQQWLNPPERARNYMPDGTRNANLRIDPNLTGSTSIRIFTEEPLDPSVNYVVSILGLAERQVNSMTTPGKVLDLLYSDKEMGVILDRERNTTTYRLFAPRATEVFLCFYDRPDYLTYRPRFRRFDPVERYRMWKDPSDGVWELTVRGLDVGRYYSFNVDGPDGEGEGFSPFEQVGDPYAYAAVSAEQNAIVIDREATNQWFGGWTDQDYRTRPREDLVIYETHVRHFSWHPSAGVPKKQRGKYDGIIATELGDAGLTHLKWLGVNTIELMPVNEYNSDGGHNWGYTTVFFFAPDSSYAYEPEKGSQYYEFKSLVNELHNRGFGVLMDVVYNHIGWPNIFSLIDRKYYFRLNDDFSHSNFSGCGNDVRSESPMMRRLIVENVMYFVEEFHIDGFRFDLSELIDMDTMHAIEKAVHAVYPDVLLAAEPWSYRGENKHELTGTGWSAWNNDFRIGAKEFVLGQHNRDWLMKSIFGSLETWAASPLQPVNYLESHDDKTLVDDLTSDPDGNGRNLTPGDVAANRLAATILFTSLGIPMIGEGQEFLRHKEGISNTYNQGDSINAVDWSLRDRPLANEAMHYYRDLIHLRTSDEGQSFRLAQRPPSDYYTFIRPLNHSALGYIVNAQGTHPGRGFLVLLNASQKDTPFEFDLPAGNWRLIGNGVSINREGLPDQPVVQGGRRAKLTVPPQTALIYMNGF